MNEREVELINISGWVGIGKIASGYGQYMSSEETQSEEKRMLSLLARQLKLIIDKYPKVAS